MIDNQFDSHLFAEFFDWQPQAFLWLHPVWDVSGIRIINFEYDYSNEEGLNYLKLTRDMLGHIRISNTPSLTDGMRQGILDEMIRVYITEETASTDLYNPVINRFGRVYRIKFRGGVPGRSEYEGTGIGLSTVQKVVANHKGQVKALGRPDEGATFLVLLPEYL